MVIKEVINMANEKDKRYCIGTREITANMDGTKEKEISVTANTKSEAKELYNFLEKKK